MDSYHETVIHNGHHCSASQIRAHIIQRILWYYNGFCNFHWNRMQRILCFLGAIRLPAAYTRDDLIQTCHWTWESEVLPTTIFNSRVCLYFFMLCVFSTAAEVPVQFQSNREQIARLGDFTRSYDKTSYHILKLGPGYLCPSAAIIKNHRIHCNKPTDSCVEI